MEFQSVACNLSREPEVFDNLDRTVSEKRERVKYKMDKQQFEIFFSSVSRVDRFV